MQKIEGSDNNQAGRDINITNHHYPSSKQDVDSKEDKQEPIRLPSKEFRIHSTLIDGIFIALIFTVLMLDMYFRLYLWNILISWVILGLGWYFMPRKFPSLLTTVFYDHINYKGEQIYYSDILEPTSFTNTNVVTLIMNNGEDVKVKFVKYSGKEYLFRTYRVYSAQQ